MLRRAGEIGLALVLVSCTQEIVLPDVHDAGPDGGPDKDAGWNMDAYCSPGVNSINYWPQPAQVLVLLDRSTDMQKAFSGTTREAAAQNALSNLVSAFTARIEFGFMAFPPDSMDSPCSSGVCCAGPISVYPDTYTASKMSASILCTGARGYGCTMTSTDSPSYAALGSARDYYRSKNPDNDAYVLLVTSSEPSCAADSRDVCSTARNYATDLGESKIRVLVLSVGYQPEPNSCLAQISQKGSSHLPQGIKALYAVNNTNDLNSTLGDIFDALSKNACTLSSLPVAPPSDAKLSVSIGQDPISQVDSVSQDGWSYASPDHTRISFNGAACTEWLDKSYDSRPYVTYPCSNCGGPVACYSQWP